MSKWFYYNESGEKIEVTGGQLKGLAKTGMITPDTIVETEEGKTAPARRVKGLTFGDTVQTKTTFPETVKSDTSEEVKHVLDWNVEQILPDEEKTEQLFCTNCGQAISEQDFACMSYGADPRSHRKFCRHCGVALNPEQIICIKCGTEVGTTTSQSTQGGAIVNSQSAPIVSTSQETSRVGLMWMHWALLFFPLVSLIIWTIIKYKVPHATTHGKHILNAFLTVMIYSVFLWVFIGIASALSSVGIANDNGVLVLVSVLIMLSVVCFGIFVVIRLIVHAVRIGIAAEKGEIILYK